MRFPNKFLKISISMLLIGISSSAYADDFANKNLFANPIEPNVNIRYDSNSIDRPKKAVLSTNNIKNQYTIAYDRFIQCNVKAAYNNYKVLIETMIPNDYAYMTVAEKMAELGFFDLSTIAANKISDKDYSRFLLDDIQRYSYPSKKMKKADEIYLAEIFSNISYNDQSREATAELVKNTDLLTNYDYANYIAALGYLKSGNTEEATKYINIAISMNNENLNYKKLKAEILAQSKKAKEALAVVDFIKKQSLYSTDYNKKVLSLEQYILYKTSKKDTDKNYHLGYYYYLENELARSLRTLQGVAINKKKAPKEVYSLLSRVYYDLHEYEKAQDMAIKAHKMDSSNPMPLIVLGDLSDRNNDYKNALKYYKDASDKEKKSPDALIKVANTYKKMGTKKKALEIYSKILKSYTNCYIAYYEIALTDKTKEYDYLKKAVAINKNFKDGWIDLARVEIEQHRFDKAKQHLAIANYIDENDFRYYYYQGLVLKAQGFSNDAEYNFKKSLLLNPEYIPAKEELSI